MKVTVLLPTASRPEMLANALGSIARQTALARVERIVVSENGGARESETICRQYPGLPIEYVFQDPPVAALEHCDRLMRAESETALMAVLCDDDWWMPGHLAGALNALESSLSAMAYFSACLNVQSETHPAGWIEIPIATRIAAGCPPSTSIWTIAPAQLLGAALLQTPFHISTLVARGPAYQRAHGFAVETSHWSYDRLLFAALALSGDVLFDPLLSVYVRLHRGNDMNRFSKKARLAMQPEAHGHVESLARKVGMDLGQFWREALKQAPLELRGRLFDNINYSLGFRGAVRYGLAGYFFRNPILWHGYRILRKWQNLRSCL